MKLHLPVLLRKALLACFTFSFTCAVSSAADLTLGSEDSLTIDYAAADSIRDLENGVLQLNGDTILLLSNCGEGDGKTYTLLTGISDLLDAEGNPLTLTDENNAIASYFDTTRPGTGFWADATLVLNNGTLQLVRHNETVKEAVTITTRQTSNLKYNYYEGISFKDIEYTVSDSDAFGGAIYGGTESTITLSNNGSVTFSGNTANSTSSNSSVYGGAISVDDGSTIALSNNGSVTFSGNAAKATGSFSNAYGGAIYGDDDSTITLNNNGSVEFIGNDVICCRDIQLYENLDVPSHACGGGAIFGRTIELSNNGSVSFCENSAIGDSDSSSSGGAIYGITITLSNNDNVSFIGNSATSGFASDGGAITGRTITLSNNGNVTFSENTAHSGGAIAGLGDSIKLCNNSSVTFSGNSTASGSGFAPPSGSAIYGYSCTITLSKNDSVTFRENSGSVIYATQNSTITLSNNGSVDFSENSGSVIYSDGHTPITLSNNGSVTFRGNSGAVICGVGLIELNNNDKVVFSGNSGSAIYGYSTGCSIMLRDNGSVTFRGNFGNNVVSGAIYTSGHNLSIRNNDSVLFEKNATVTNGGYKLRSIYSWLGSAELSLSAAAGKSIEFRDSVYIGSDDTVELNADYTDAAGVVHKQMGDIIFTGKYTEQHLNELLATDDAGRTANAEEILASRTTVVNPTATLFNGRLIIKEGAIWSGSGITVDPVAGATGKPTLLLQNGILTHGASSATSLNVVTIKSGGAFEVAGKSQADYTSLNMESGSILTFNIAPENASTAALTLDSNSSLTQEGALTLKLKGDNGLVKGQSYKLLTGLAQPDTWDETSVTVDSGSLGWDVDYTDLTWEGDTLWIYYDGNILPEPEFAPNLDRNQQVVYDTIKDIMGGGNPGGLLGELGKEVTGTRDEAKLKELLDSLGGAEYATLLSGQQAAASGHMRRLRGEMGSGHLLAGTKTRAYIEAYNHRSEVDGDSGGRGYELNESGGQFALEFLGKESVSGGFAVAAGRSRLQPDGGMTQKSDNTYVDAFLLHRDGAYTGKFSLGVGVHKYDLDRRVAGNAVSADASGSSVNFMHESSYSMTLNESNSVQVFGAVESSFNKLGSFHEKGADTASLQVESQDAWVTTLSVGARYLHSFAALDSAPAATLSLQGGLEFDFGDTDGEVEMNFEGARDYRFRQSGAERDTFGYNLGASLHVPVSDKAAIYANGDAVLRGDSYEVNANVGLQMAF